MDERHWWFASKLQETFHFGGYDNPMVLEDFLSESHVVDLINKFLSPGDPQKLFFYCDATPPSSHCSPVPSSHEGELQSPSTGPSRQLHAVSHLTKDVLAQGCVCLYVLRKSIETEVDASSMEKELYCGELKHSILSNMATLLSEAYSPILHAQINWKECSDETVTNFLQSFSKISGSLSDSALKAQIYQPVLQRPSHELRSFLIHGQDLQHRGPGAGSKFEDVIEECEALVVDWVGTVESLLIDATDER
jgi:dynein heavy chain